MVSAFLAGDFREAAGEQQFRFVEQVAQQLALPAIPDTGSDCLDVADRKDQQQFHPVERLNYFSEILDRLAVVEIARLRHHTHGQMLLNEPGNGFRIRFG